ncbi:glycosyltransferase [Actinomyces wuliandei]|uniref:glycosyltransferase n=1 Tax=Actinomyces wuliandei TaxID=2057743 RepID=UPI000FDABF20|nr:glycosyltransferase [Actinomyces wuliandei]
MARNATGLVGLMARAATTRPGMAVLETVVLARLDVSLRRNALAGALEVARRARFLADRHRFSQARRLLRRAASQMGERPEVSVLRLEDCIIDLDVDGGDSRRAATAAQYVLDLADQAWAAEEDACVAGLLDLVLRLMFHPQLHFGATDSALSVDPHGFLAPLRASRAFQEVTRPVAVAAAQQREPVVPDGGAALPATRERPRRVLFLSLKNWNFVTDIITDYDADERFEVRCQDLGDLPVVPEQSTVLALRVELARGRGHRVVVPQKVADDLAWADTVFVEWGSAAAVWASLMVPLLAPRARLLIRIHSYEASTAMPQLVDWNAVSELVTVSPAIRRMLETTVRLPGHVVVSTVPNRALLTRFRLPKTAGSARTIALVGWAARRKDPAWALDVLDLVRQEDPSWSLLLIGPDFPEDMSEAEAAYAEATRARIEDLGPSVRITGRTAQVPAFLREAGVILSSSRREGTHEGFIEGAASGALPVVRNWPDVARWGGPGALFPAQWVVATPQEAAARILSLCDDEAYRVQQAEWMVSHADWSAVRPRYDALLLGQDREGRPDDGAAGVATGPPGHE